MKTTMFSSAVCLGAALVLLTVPTIAQDAGKTAAAELTKESQTALARLVASAPLAKGIAPTAHAVLVFPEVTKAGLGIGGQYGEGTLLKSGKATAFYKTTGASFGPSVVLVDEGTAKTTTTTTLKDDIYAFVFSQKGAMAGLGIQGNRIARIQPK